MKKDNKNDWDVLSEILKKDNVFEFVCRINSHIKNKLDLLSIFNEKLEEFSYGFTEERYEFYGLNNSYIINTRFFNKNSAEMDLLFYPLDDSNILERCFSKNFQDNEWEECS